MQLSFKGCLSALLVVCFSAAAVNTAYSQDSKSTINSAEDEIIVFGKRRTAGNRGMAAFNAGDYKTAEIEFDKHYTSLRRADRALQNAAIDGAASALTTQIAQGLPQASATGLSAPSPSPTVSVNAKPFANGASLQANPSLTNLVNNGKVTYKNFAFAKYMSGLTQIQLGKLDEAKLSFRESVDHYGKNYDARLRLGLLELRDGDYDSARKQLLKLDKLRKDCRSKCKDYEGIRSATLSLAKALSAKR